MLLYRVKLHMALNDTAPSPAGAAARGLDVGLKELK